VRPKASGGDGAATMRLTSAFAWSAAARRRDAKRMTGAAEERVGEGQPSGIGARVARRPGG